ncbi:hypothetical protein [Leifsonia xyli]|uniref:hypothetical protein n=1 Tax=Leifsonia xyli TaxID=1575 RepID=UPI003D667A09
MIWLQAVGWAGSVLLVVSLLQSRMLVLRWLNLAASVLLVGFNAALGVWPMVAMNAAVCVIDAVHIRLLSLTRRGRTGPPTSPVG